MKYGHIIAEFYSRAWAIREETLMAMQELIRLQASGVKWSPEEIRDRIDASNEKNGTHKYLEPQVRYFDLAAPVAFDQELENEQRGPKARSAGAKSGGTVALIPIVGIISHRMNMMSSISGPGGTSIQKLTAQFRQAMDDTNCKAIVFDVDSPGGSVEGVPELAAEILEARKQKPITAVFNSMGCSAAYWLASAASDVVCTPSGQCGSIGVYMMHQDESKALENEGVKITLIKAGRYKAEGDPTQPLSDEARQAFQSMVDNYYGMFVKAVAQNRGTTQAKVREGYGEGRSLLAADAVKANLADREGTLDDVLGKYGVKSASSYSAANAQSPVSGQTVSPKAAAVENDGNDDEEDEEMAGPCGCACNACKGCTGSVPQGESDESCRCAGPCDACKACTGGKKSGAKAEQQRKAKAAIERRRRQLSLH